MLPQAAFTAADAERNNLRGPGLPGHQDIVQGQLCASCGSGSVDHIAHRLAGQHREPIMTLETPEEIAALLKGAHVTAMVGASANPARDSPAATLSIPDRTCSATRDA